MVDPVIDCGTCQHWALHGAGDLEPAYVFGRWHHPAHAEDLLRRRHCSRAASSVRAPSGVLVPLNVDGDADGETH
ncbi:MAG: hypothetical protein JWM53_5780 [bacterium]|nr:hypothetical protein [bacterium]